MKPKPAPVEDPGRTARRKVFIVEDHPVFREGLVQIINSEDDLTVCGEAADAEQALEAIPSLKPDLVLVDISLPGKSGLELIKDLRARNGGVKLLVLSMHDEALYADRVLRAGGDGYIMKQEDPEEVVHAIRDVLGGHIYVSDEIMAGGAKGAEARRSEPKSRPLGQLTDMELEVLELLGEGKTNLEIARQLHFRAWNGQCSLHADQEKTKLEEHQRPHPLCRLLGRGRQSLSRGQRSVAVVSGQWVLTGHAHGDSSSLVGHGHHLAGPPRIAARSRIFVRPMPSPFRLAGLTALGSNPRPSSWILNIRPPR